MIDYELSFLIAVCAVTYVCILTDPGMIFCELYKWLDERLNSIDQPCSATCERCRKPSWWKKFLFKIVIGCEKCFAGQAALWTYFVVCTQYHVLQHVFFILVTIFLTSVIKGLYYKYTQT